jgi:hypothetical protein
LKKSIIAVVLALALALPLAACGKKDGGDGVATTTEYLFSLKNEYIGNAPGSDKIMQALEMPKLGEYTLELDTADATPNILTVNEKISGNLMQNAGAYE